MTPGNMNVGTTDPDASSPPDSEPLEKDEDSMAGEEKKGGDAQDEDADEDHQPKATPVVVTPTKEVSPAVRVPAFCLTQGLSRKESAYKLESWIALSLTLDGRDKITKVFQYSARFLAWWLAGSAQAERFEAVKTSLTTSRKAFRLGRALIEYYKLRSMGLVQTLGWHLRQTLVHDADEDDALAHKPVLRHQASSNIGWGPSSAFERESQPQLRRTLYRSLSGVAYRRLYRPLMSRMSSRMVGDDAEPPESPMWMIVGSAMKMVGLFGFWTGDNISFLTAAGLFDDMSADKADRMAKRKDISTSASKAANQFYFFGALAGLLVNLRSYLAFRAGALQKAQRELVEMGEEEPEDERHAVWLALENAKEKEFALFVALLKSCCDVLVFSNNPGVDLWMKYRGKKLHEGVHCVGGLLSASTVIYNSFPNKKPTK